MKSRLKLPALLLLAAILFAAGAAHAQISGHLVVCRGASRTILTGTPSGGTWSSGDATRATINATTGEVAGINTGTATISYTDPTSAVHTAVVTVNTYVMSAIGFSMGTDMRCTNGAIAICTISPIIGNNWFTSDGSVATINTSGQVTPGSTAGTVVISYRHGYGNCYVTRNITVNPTPTVSVATPMCAGTTQTAGGVPSGGTWVSTNTGVGTISSATGVLGAISGGGTGIRYTVGGCFSQPSVTVLSTPAAITGATTVCVGNSGTLVSATSGGTWSSTNPSVATIGSSSGVVSGIGAGTTTVSYIVGSGCFRTAVVTVNAGVSASTGPDEMCAGQTITVSNSTGGGTWSSSNTSRATVTTYAGVVAGIAAGTVNISYRIGAGCLSVKAITVNATMATISGGPNVCEGATVSLSHSMSGGTWVASSSNATVGATTGVVTGVTAGASYITYTASPGCVKVKMITVKSVPAAITGTLTVCPGATTALSSATGGGTWSSGNTAVATVSGSGVTTGISGGTATISYTVASWGCSTTAVVTVSSTGGSISGSTMLYPGLTSTLSAAGSGTWSSSNTSVATVGSSNGVVSAVAAGTAAITYSSGSCSSISTVVTVLATPAPIVGDAGLEAGEGTTLTNPIPGGLWSSSNTSVATIGSTSGVLTALSAGTSTISYTIGSTYVATLVVTVSSLAPSGSCDSKWLTVAGNYRVATCVDWSEFDMTVDNCGVPLIAVAMTYSLVATTGVRVLKYDGEKYVQLGPVVSPDSAEFISVAAATDGTVYVAYDDFASGRSAAVKKFDGTTWIDVASSGISGGTAHFLRLAIGSDNNPLLAFSDGANGWKATVMKYNGSSWTPVGTAGFSASAAEDLSLCLDGSDVPYVSFESWDTSFVAKFDGTSWVLLGNNGSLDGADPKLAVAADGSAYIVLRNEEFQQVKRLDTTTWVSMGSFNTWNADIMTASDGNPWLAYSFFPDGIGIEQRTRIIRFNGSSWVQAGGDYEVAGYYGLCVALSAGNEPYVALKLGNDHVISYRLDAGQSKLMPGERGIGGYFSWYNSSTSGVTFDSHNVPYIGYMNYHYPAIRQYTDGMWQKLDSEPIWDWDPLIPISSLDVVLDDHDAVIVAQSMTAGADPGGVIVRRFAGGLWDTLGAPFGNYPYGTSLIVSKVDVELDTAGIPYVLYNGFDYGQTYVRRFDGSAWVALDTAGMGLLLPQYTSLAMDGENKPYIFLQNSPWEPEAMGIVKKYNGSSWVTVGSGYSAPEQSKYNKIAIGPGNIPYIAYADGANGDKLVVKRFVSGSWTLVGPDGISPGAVAGSTIAFNASGIPYIAFSDATNDNRVTVMTFDGTNWVLVVSPGFSDTGAGHVNISFDNADVPYVSFEYRLGGTSASEPMVVKLGSPVELSGNGNVCVGSSVSVSSHGGGGWASSNTSVATVNCVGLVTGVSAGTAAISYTVDTCVEVMVVTVNAAPSAGTVSGSDSVAVGGSISLSPSVSGGVWSSANADVATVGSADGTVSGISTGVATISYTVTSGGCSSSVIHPVTAFDAGGSRPGTSKGEVAFLISPNPTRGNINVSSPVAGVVSLSTIDGRELKKENIKAGLNAYMLPSGSVPGVYILRFAGEDGTVKTTRLVYQP